MIRATLKTAFACLLIGWLMPESGHAATPPLEYNRDVRPILVENCFSCHGADSAARKAKLRLDSYEEATAPREGARPAVVAGKPQESEAILRIRAESEDDVMPPPASRKVLSLQQKQVLERWVAEGAKYQPHWSFIAPVKEKLPVVRDSRWVRNPIDAFILARLEREGLKPAPEADRRALARRLSYDLTGLPPKPEDVEAFVKDKSPDAYEKLVDRWMASPHWGEHRARYWLDVARYADTHGIHFDNYREIWAYRDWVINAFNANVPFDRFTIEQLAGDLLPNATREQKIATGFNRCNITTSEGGAIEDEYLVLYARDRTETASQIWLGMTAGCAVCHDHKYDPLSQREFYQLSAYFNNNNQRAMDGNVKDTPPVLVLPKPNDETRWQQLPAAIEAAQKRADDHKSQAKLKFDAWLKQPDLAGVESAAVPGQPVFHAALSEGGGEALGVVVNGADRKVPVGTNAIWLEGAIADKAWQVGERRDPEFAEVGRFERTNQFSCAVWVKRGGPTQGAVLSRMRDGGDYRGWDLYVEGGRPAAHLIHRWSGNALKVVGKKELPKEKWAHLCVTYDGSSKASGLKLYVNGEPVAVNIEQDSLTESVLTDAPFVLGHRSGGSRLNGWGMQDLRIYSRQLAAPEIKSVADIARLKWFAARPVEKRGDDASGEIFGVWLRVFDAEYPKLTQAADALRAESAEIKKRSNVAYVMSERETPPEAYLLFRGEYDKRRDKLAPGTPKILPPLPSGAPSNRLGLAQWLVRPEHPLTARVTVNRFWQELFGTGIVRTAGDFGLAGEMPSHPELLDWMAVEFREQGWDVKKFFRLLVTSATYRQSAVVTPEKLARDPQNRLLARGARFRMDAEMIRDTALASSGLLVERIGGPSVRPYQPDGIWEAVAMPESDTRHYKRDSGESLYRRSLYTFWKRAAPPASLDVLNAPSRETCTVRRERTDTPLQALVTLNDPQFVEAARNLAERALLQAGSKPDQRIEFMAQRLIARPLSGAERGIVKAVLKDLMSHYHAAPQAAAALVAVGESKPDPKLDPPTLAAYTMVANQLLNLDEVLNK